jgi:hypothetical protein
MAEEELELGDYIVILGGSLNKTKGKIYQFSADRFAIQPSGATDRLIRIPLVDGMPDPDLGIVEIKLLKKAAAPGFVHLVDLRAGQMVETFLESSEAPERGPIFKVVSVNEDTDSAVFEDEAGGQTDIVFGFTGIPRDLGYEVIRTREATPVVREVEEGLVQAQPRSTLEVAVDEEDVAEYGEVPTAAEDSAEKPTFMIGEEIELPAMEEIEEVGSAFRVYQDVFQRSEMLGQLIRNLPPNQQRNPVKLQEIRRSVELMMLMRNDVVHYGITGEPLGKAKATSMNTLADLITRPDVSLIRKVANVSKVLYLDHSAEHYLSISKGRAGTDPSAGPIEEGLYVEYGAEIIGQAATLMKQAGMGAGEGEVIGMPKFFVDLEEYRKKIQAPYRMSPFSGPMPKVDEEVFRLEIPSKDTEDANLNVLANYPGKLSKAPPVNNPPVVIQHPFGIARMLKPRITRFTTGEEYRIVETGENPSFNTVVVFPKSTLRDLGPIRSGILAQDISLGMTETRLMSDILASVEDISDQPTSDGILLLGVGGGTVGNILVKDWLDTLDMNISGTGDTLVALRGYGSLSVEWNADQMAVIQKKVEQRLAALRIFLIKQREENKTTLSNLKFDPMPLLSGENAARLLSRIDSEPILQKVVEEVKSYMGELADTDVYWFTYVVLAYPDLLLATLGQQPETLTKERLRNVREQYNRALALGYRIKQKLLTAGQIPVENTCPHIAEIEKVAKLGHKFAEEPRDTTKMKGLLKVLNRFRGKVEDDWVWCNRCDQHLLCGHELLQIQEFLRPKEKDALHKELILKFSGGQFGGRFICRVCGQGLQDLDFDTNIEFDDAGRPMMGRSVMVDQEAIEEEEINALLSGPAAEEERGLQFDSDELTQAYKSVKKICSLVGISPDHVEYKKMVADLNNYTSGLASRAAYAAAAKGKKAQDYDIWYSIRYVSAAAAIVLLNIQTHIPDYIVYYTTAECKDGFFGYPLESEDKQAGISCVATVIAGINDNEFPWNLTTLQKQGNLQKRKEAILPFVKNQIDAFIKFPSIQNSLKKKRDYRIKLYGTSEGIKRDSISGGFRPVPYIVEKEDAAKEALVVAAASSEKQATAWIRLAHGIAKENAALNPDSPYSETTSCLHPLNTTSACWDSLPKLEARVTGKTTRSGTVSTTFYTEKQKALEGKLDSKDYYRLFVKVCYQGDKKGLPHELGLGLVCRNCDLAFEENPSLMRIDPTTEKEEGNSKKREEIDRKKTDEMELKAKAYLESQGIPINEETFNELLMVSRQKEAVSVDAPPYMPKKADIFDWVIQYPPIDGWEALISRAQVALAEIESGGQLTRIQIATAAEDLVRSISEKEDFVKGRLGAQVYGYLQSIMARTPRECGEAVSTYLLVPFQRWVSGVDISQYSILDSYEISEQTANDILLKGMGAHLQNLGSGEELVGIAKQKVKGLVADLSVACKQIFPYIRTLLTPGGKDMVQYIIRAYVIGALHKFIDPHQIPETISEDAEGTVPNMKLLYKSLGQALTKYAVGSKIPSEEEIRIGLSQRAEKEKQVKMSKFEHMTREERRVELVLKGLGMGEWAIGGSKAIRQYDEDRYEAERAERAAAGITDYLQGQGQAQEERPIDMFGTDFGGDYDAAGERGDGGYDHDEMLEEDY